MGEDCICGHSLGNHPAITPGQRRCGRCDCALAITFDAAIALIRGLEKKVEEAQRSAYEARKSEEYSYMTLRDTVAMAALPALITRDGLSAAEVAHDAYLFGDAMIEARRPEETE